MGNINASVISPHLGINFVTINEGVVTNNISGANSVLNILSDVNMCNKTLNIGNIESCNNLLTINGNVNVDSLTSNTVTTSCLGIVTDNITACSNNINIISDVSLHGNLLISNNLIVNTITSKTGTLDFNDTDVTTSGLLTSCNLKTQTITSCGLNINFESPITTQAIGSNNSNPLLFTSDLQICGHSLIAETISSCSSELVVVSPGIITNNILSDNYNLTNVSLGKGVSLLGDLTGPNGNIRNFKSFVSNTISITQNSSSINLEINSLTDGNNLGTGSQIHSHVFGNSLNFRSLNNTDGKLSIVQTKDEVIVNVGNGNIVSAQNIGTGTGNVFSSESGNILSFNTLSSLSPHLTINTIGNEVVFNSAFSNNMETGTFTSPASIKPKTWTNYLTPSISSNPNFNVTSNGIHSIHPSFRIIFTISINMNMNPDNLVSIDATLVLFRFVNSGFIRSNKTQQVIDDISVNNSFDGNFDVQYEFYDSIQASNALLQVWHNGTSDWTGNADINFMINNA